MKQTIYVVTHGAYSDRGVVGVFSDQQRADDLAGIDPDGGFEAFALDEIDTTGLHGMTLFRVYSKPSSVEIAGCYPFVSLRSLVERNTVTIGIDDALGASVLARDAAHARKIAADLFREFVAMEKVAEDPRA